jgi:LmbE family N-acetylglucosaminyl deacetylase/SAM-dependent methyltransferase
LVVISAHPDDETLGAGALIATAGRRGVPVTVIVATAGEGSHPESPTQRPDQLAAIRRREVLAAISRLAPTASVHQLSLTDGRIADSTAELADEIRSVLDSVDDAGSGSGSGTWLVAPWSADRHPDHAAVSAAARQVATGAGCRLLEFPVWAWHWASPGDHPFPLEALIGLQVSDDVLSIKDLALAEHRSQTEPLSDQLGDEPVVGAAFAEHFRRDVEVFVDVSFVPSTITEPAESLGRDYFDRFYGTGPDPWGFESRWYEERKRAITMASLPRRRFSAAFEPGCAIGVLTAELAERCDQLLASDIASAPLETARQRLAGRPQVTFVQLQVPSEWPAGPFDLVVLSEIGYYCDRDDLAELIRRAASSLTDDGVLLACHWRHPVADYPLSGDQVHEQLRAESGLAVQAEHIEEDFRLDVLVRPTAVSVARSEGLTG